MITKIENNITNGSRMRAVNRKVVFGLKTPEHNTKKNDMLAPGITYNTMETIKQYQLTLNMAELIITGELQRYASRMMQYMQDNGLYRQRPKQNINAITKALQKMQFDFSLYEQHTSIKSITQSFPIYEKLYVEEGESVNMKVQQAYSKSASDKVQLMFFGYKQLFDKHRLIHAELVAAAYTIMELSLTARDVSKTIHALIEQSVYGYVTGNVPDLKVLSKIEVMVREVLSDVIKDAEVECDTDEFKAIRQPLAQIATGLVDGRPVKAMLNAIAEHTFRYMDFCMVKLWQAVHNGMTDKEREAIDELGIDTDGLIALLKAMPIPEYEDVWDLQEALPSGEEIDGTPICDFYLKCCDRVPYICDLNKMRKNNQDYQL